MERIILDTLRERREFEEAFKKGAESSYLCIIEMIERRITERCEKSARGHKQ